MTADHTGTTQEMLHDSLAADLPMEDRGLAYGEGVFETILVRDGQPQLW